MNKSYYKKNLLNQHTNKSKLNQYKNINIKLNKSKGNIIFNKIILTINRFKQIIQRKSNYLETI